MRRCSGLFSIGLSLLAIIPAQSQQIYSQQLNFKTTNQSMWNASLGDAGYDYKFGLIQKWNTNGDLTSNSYKSVPLLGTFGAGATVNTAGQTGLTFNAYATGGSVDVDYPMTIKLSYPDPLSLSPGQTFTLTSSYVPASTAQMSTHSPDAGVTVGALLQADPLTVKLNVKLFGANVINNTIIDKSFDLNKTLFDTHSLETGSIQISSMPITGTYHPPVVTTSGKPAAGAAAIKTSGADSFLTFTADFSQILDPALGSHGFSASKKGAKVSGNYSLLDLYGSVPVAMAQSFQFNPQPNITLNLPGGKSVTFAAGSSVQITMPADGSPLTISPVVTLNNQFTNTTSVKIGAGLYFNPFSISAKLSLVGVSLPSLSFQPIKTIDVLSGNVATVPVYSTTFTLPGLAPQTLPPLTLVTLSATNQNITPTYNGSGWQASSAAPGLLAACYGPAGIRALEETLTASSGSTFHLNYDGSYQYQGVAGSGTDVFPYTIYYGTHVSTGTVTFTRSNNSVPLVAPDINFVPNFDGNAYNDGSSAPGLLDFCKGPVGFQTAIETLTAPSGSTFHLDQDGSFSYNGVPGIGNDTFKYTIFYGTQTATGTVTFIRAGG